MVNSLHSLVTAGLLFVGSLGSMISYNMSQAKPLEDSNLIEIKKIENLNYTGNLMFKPAVATLGMGIISTLGITYFSRIP